MIVNQSDIITWEAYKKGDRNALGQLFQKYYDPLFRFGCKLTQDHNLLEDCIQELFTDLWQNKSLTDVQSVKAYLFKALKYKTLRALQKRNGTSLYPDDNHLTSFEISHETLLVSEEENRERAARVIMAMQQLSNRQREIIYLKFYQELSYEEVSEVMNINYQVARNLLYQSIKAMKKIMGI